MAEENITYISYEETESIIEDIIDCKNRMNAIFEDFKQDMANIGAPDNLSGGTSETLTTKFASLSTKFDDYLNLVQEFADDIRAAREMTEETDQRISNSSQELNY